MKFAGDRASVTKKAFFNIWKEDWMETMAQKRFDEQMALKMAEMNKNKKDAGMKTMMKMIGGREDMLKKATFGGWHEEMKAAKYERQQEEMRNEFMAQLNAQGDQAL